jgi:hypothetical protein
MFTGLLLSGVLAAATQLSPAILGPASVPREVPDAPFARLFEPPQPSGAPQARDRQPGEQAPRLIPPGRRAVGPRTKIVCGMTLLIVGAEADPEMPKPPKDGVTYTMRRYPPPACGKEK